MKLKQILKRMNGNDHVLLSGNTGYAGSTYRVDELLEDEGCWVYRVFRMAPVLTEDGTDIVALRIWVDY